MEIKKHIDQHHERTGGMSGISLPELAKASKMEIRPLKLKLKQLVKNNEITIREGINGILIFKK